jgi:hypothetical protein
MLFNSSASTILRKEIGRKALLQVGVAIPVYALTQKGKDLVLACLSGFKDKLVTFRTAQLPYEVRGKGPKLEFLTDSQSSVRVANAFSVLELSGRSWAK